MKSKKLYTIFVLLFVMFCTRNVFSDETIALNEDEKVKFILSKSVNATYDDENLFVVEKDNSFFTKEVEVFSNKSKSSSLELDVLGITFKTVEINPNETKKVYPGGNAISITMSTDGVLVLSIGNVNDIEGNILKPSEGKLNVGDIIYKVDGVTVENKEQLSELIKSSDGEVLLTVKQGEELNEILIEPSKSIEDEEYKIGIWVRDSTQGIGTVTYITEDKEEFYALGHGITDIDTRELMTVKDGEASLTKIISVQKGKKGVPGELIGEIKTGETFGNIVGNKEIGVYGKLDVDYKEEIDKELMEVGRKEDIKTGPATILSNIDSDTIKSYDIFIEKVDLHNSTSKGITLTITDKELIEKTGGIVQGMSGSPIIQDGKIVGAVTHVFVNDPLKGYGVFIENMMS